MYRSAIKAYVRKHYDTAVQLLRWWPGQCRGQDNAVAGTMPFCLYLATHFTPTPLLLANTLPKVLGATDQCGESYK